MSRLKQMSVYIYRTAFFASRVAGDETTCRPNLSRFGQTNAYIIACCRCQATEELHCDEVASKLAKEMALGYLVRRLYFLPGRFLRGVCNTIGWLKFTLCDD